ncbi:hypothetical protein HZH66_012497 [Vespula vulgaris]|uniref:Uncharacterized protein n=1 Tax=Vespula vulgaris TaxID=7454 RepID=A0A834JA50_VESVU|nr:hypothetical protein HZH66_012497 [Vespula vulgaris]
MKKKEEEEEEEEKEGEEEGEEEEEEEEEETLKNISSLLEKRFSLFRLTAGGQPRRSSGPPKERISMDTELFHELYKDFFLELEP